MSHDARRRPDDITDDNPPAEQAGHCNHGWFSMDAFFNDDGSPQGAQGLFGAAIDPAWRSLADLAASVTSSLGLRSRLDDLHADIEPMGDLPAPYVD